MMDKYIDMTQDDEMHHAMCTVAQGLKDLPAVNAVLVVHARWIHDINNLYGCSECMARETMSHKKLKKFCPNCGARMDAEEKPDAD